MQNLDSLKNKAQGTISNLVERGKEQPEDVKTWGVTIAAGVGGAVALTAVAKGLTAIVATLASPPFALTIGALGGGALGWSWLQKQEPDVDQSAVNQSAVVGEQEPSATTVEVVAADARPENVSGESQEESA